MNWNALLFGLMLAVIAGAEAYKWRRHRARASAVRAQEPLIRLNHANWKEAVYNPKEHRSPSSCDQ